MSSTVPKNTSNLNFPRIGTFHIPFHILVSCYDGTKAVQHLYVSPRAQDADRANCMLSWSVAACLRFCNEVLKKEHAVKVLYT